MKIGLVSQKGGVGKSILARLIACEYASSGWSVKIADMDVSQSTSYAWQSRRLENRIEPEISVEQFSRIEQALRVSNTFDLIVFDGAPHATATTLKIAKESNLVILPTGISLDDLEPTIKLAHELKHNGIKPNKITIALCRVGDSITEIQEAKDYIKDTGYYLLNGAIPERTGYRRASDAGRAATETAFNSLNDKAGQLMQSIVDKIKQLEGKGVSFHGKSNH